MVVNKLSKEDKQAIKKYVLFEVRHLAEYERRLKEIEEDIIYQSGNNDTGIRSIGSVSDPTSQKAIKLTTSTEIIKMQEKVQEMKRVRDNLTPQLRMVWDRILVKGETAAFVAMDECIDVSRIHKRIRHLITLLSNEFGITSDF